MMNIFSLSRSSSAQEVASAQAKSAVNQATPRDNPGVEVPSRKETLTADLPSSSKRSPKYKPQGRPQQKTFDTLQIIDFTRGFTKRKDEYKKFPGHLKKAAHQAQSRVALTCQSNGTNTQFLVSKHNAMSSHSGDIQHSHYTSHGNSMLSKRQSIQPKEIEDTHNEEGLGNEFVLSSSQQMFYNPL